MSDELDDAIDQINTMRGTNDKLRAEIDRLTQERDALNARIESHNIRANVAIGERDEARRYLSLYEASDSLTTAPELRAEYVKVCAERDELKAALELGQINCDAAYDDLRAERDATAAELQAVNDTLVVITTERDALLDANRQLQEERDFALLTAEESQLALIEYAPAIIRAEQAHGQEEPHA